MKEGIGSKILQLKNLAGNQPESKLDMSAGEQPLSPSSLLLDLKPARKMTRNGVEVKGSVVRSAFQ